MKKKNKYEIVVIGASTGGPPVVRDVLMGLSKDFPLGIAIVQHIEHGFDKQYVNWLNSLVSFNVYLASNYDFPYRGEVYVAPVGKHLIFKNKKLVLDDGPHIQFQKPSVDRLFSTAAEEFKTSVIGIQLTGMGSDGANGCHDIVEKGGYTIVQNEETSVIYGMPKEAVKKGGASIVLPAYEIADYLMELVNNS